jgi:hypothetical protein
VRLDIRVVNTSDQPIFIWQEGYGRAESANHIEVRDASGNPLPRTDGPIVLKDGKPVHLPINWLTRKGTFLKPGEKSDDFSILSNMFDLTRPGKYLVTVEQDIHHGSSPTTDWTNATSKTIDITVVD